MKTEEKLLCPKCNTHDYGEVLMEKRYDGELQLRVECTKCGKWIKWAKQGNPYYFEFGKHNGKEIKHVHDINYLEWVLKNVKGKGLLFKAAVRNQVQRLRNKEI